MPLEINKDIVNGLILGQREVDTDRELATQLGLHLEFDPKVNLQRSIILTVSKRDLNYFILNNENVSINNFSTFLAEEEVLLQEYDDYKNYTFPRYNLTIMVNNNLDKFEEVLVYHRSLKELYENGINNLNSFKKSKDNFIFSDNEIIYPYRSIGSFNFGMNSKFIPNHEFNETEKNSYEIDNTIFKFKESKLIQISMFDNTLKLTNFYFNSIIINSNEGFQRLKEKYDFIERKNSRYVFQDIGICINEDLTELFVFDKSLLPLWSNNKRPITSW